VRDRLFDLQLIESTVQKATMRYIGSCQNDGTLLRPEQMVTILEQVSEQELHLLTIHRIQLFLA
jgi:uncharacterized protein (DUF2344 family)